MLVLTPTAAATANDVQRWNKQPRMASNSSNAKAAAATLLNHLQITAPSVPRLFALHNTAEELASALHDITSLHGATKLAQAWDGVLESIATSGEGSLADALHALAADLRLWQEQLDIEWITTWDELLTPYTGCMSRGKDGPRGAVAAPAPHNHCLLRLDFASPLSSLFAQQHLRRASDRAAAQTAAAATAASQHGATTPPPRAHLELQHYRRRLTTVEVVGFAVGAIDPGEHALCTSAAEPHGNWDLLRQFLTLMAPNCHPSTTFKRLHNGKTAVEFVLEETHRYQLHRLCSDKNVYPAYGITSPMRLEMQGKSRSTDTACFHCGQAGHSAGQCPTPPAAGTKNCKRCYKPGHTANVCTLAKAAATCGICGLLGHPTTSCARYHPQAVKIPVRKPSAPQDHRNYAAASLATMQGHPQSKPQPAAYTPRYSVASSMANFPALPSRPGQPAWQQPTKQHTSTPAPQQTTADSQVAALTQLVATMLQMMEKQAQQVDRLLNALTAMHTQQKEAPWSGHSNHSAPHQHQHTISPTASTASLSSTPSPSTVPHRARQRAPHRAPRRAPVAPPVDPPQHSRWPHRQQRRQHGRCRSTTTSPHSHKARDRTTATTQADMIMRPLDW